jgi:tripartite-type tricarboxylate transporter receptor subunit TctC
MHFPIHRRRFNALAALGLGTLPFAARAQAIDTLKIIAGFAPGGTVDTVSRRVGDKLTGSYAKSVIVENRTGAGGQIAVQAIKGMPADGTAILTTPASMLMIYPHIYKKLPYDAFADATPLSLACSFDFGLGVGPMVPATVKSVPDFLAWAKANPTMANYGSPAAGSVPHFVGELVSRAGGVDLRHVPYRGSQPAILELIGGQVAAVSAPVGEFLQHLPGGKIRLIATSGAKRNRFAPAIPTYVEQGLKDIQFSEWFAFFGPGKMPAEAVAKLNGALREALASKDVIDALALMGMEATASTAPELGVLLKRDHDRWGPIVKQIGFTAES